MVGKVATVAPKNAHAWIARRGALGFAGATISALAGFTLTLVLSRGMGPEGAGIVMQTMAVFLMLVALSKVGMDSTAIFLLPRVKDDAPDMVRAHMRFMVLLAAAVSVVVGAGLWLLAPLIWGEVTPALVTPIRAVAWFLPAGAVLLVSAGAMRALGGMRAYVLTQNLGLPLLRLATVGAAVAAAGSTLTVSIMWAAPLLLMCFIGVEIVRRQVARLSVEQQRGLSKQQWYAVISFAAPRTMSAGLEQALVWIDIVLVGHNAGAAAAGIYAGASRFIQAGMIVDTALRVVVSPRLSVLVHQGNKAQIMAIHSTTTSWLILFASPIYILMAVFAPTVMSVLGPEFVAGAATLQILSAALAVTFFAGNIHTLLIMSGRSRWAAVNKSIVLAMNVVGNLIFIPYWGIEAAALVWAVSMLTDAALATMQVRYFLGVWLPLRTYILPLSIVALSVLAPALLVLWFAGQGAWQCVGASILSVLLFVGACIYWREDLHLHNLRSARQ